MTPDQRLGARIKQLRKDAGLTQERMGKLLKLRQAAICRIESGKQKITAVQLHVLAKGFGVKTDEFFEVRGSACVYPSCMMGGGGCGYESRCIEEENKLAAQAEEKRLLDTEEQKARIAAYNAIAKGRDKS
jgi:transcriptional regulator with XRE-family HTH domain